MFSPAIPSLAVTPARAAYAPRPPPAGRVGIESMLSFNRSVAYVAIATVPSGKP